MGRLFKLSLKAEQLTLTRLASAMSKATRCRTGRLPPPFLFFLQLFEQNLFWFTLAVGLDVILQVWDNGKDQRQEGRFPSLQDEEHPLLIISSVHYDWNSKRAWPQRFGLSVSSRHSAVSHCEGSFPLSRWLHALHHYGLGNNRLCYCFDIQQIR